MKTLKAFNYFGAKNSLSELITDMIDYKNTDQYIELFGGGASILLNKARHKKETYIELDNGLCAMFRCLSEKDIAKGGNDSHSTNIQMMMIIMRK